MGNKKDKLTSEGIHVSNQKILDRYILNCRNKGLTEKSIDAICNNDIKLFLQFIGKKKLRKTTHEDIEMFLMYCLTERKNSNEALNRKFTSLNQFYNTLIKQETKGIERNPLDKLTKPKVRKKERAYLTLEEYEKLLNYTDMTNDLRGGALISLFFSSGCRLSEIWQLNKNSLDFTSRSFKVLGKGQKERMCVFSEDAKDRINAYLKSRTDILDALFISREHNRWSKKAIEVYVKNTVKKAGINKDITPHCLRHTRAMALIRQDVPIQIIQKLLGHESIATTQIYARTDMTDVKKKLDAIDAA